MEKLKVGILVCFIAMLVVNVQAASNTSSFPKIFQNSIPTKLFGNLTLIEVESRCSGCQPWRVIDYYSNTSDQPIKQVKVSVKGGYKAMYAYPSTQYFANTKIEQSASGYYDMDKSTTLDALEHEYKRRSERINGYLKENPNLIEKMEPFKASGKDYIDLEKSNYSGVEYIALNENVIGLTSDTISQVHIFDDKRKIIITAYLLNQEKAKFTTIEEFIVLKRNFIEGYINFLVGGSIDGS